MKKIIAITSVLSVLAGASAFAKTEGNYLGLDLHRADVRSRTDNRVTPVNHSYTENVKTGLGINYKYAFNFNKVFVAPGVFYERIGVKNYGAAEFPSVDYFAVKNRYGARVDLGYDITDTFAAYVTAGLGRTSYVSALADTTGTGIPGEVRKTKLGMLYGVGVLSKINNDISLGFEYNTQNLSVNNEYQLAGQDKRTKATIDIYKVTLAYHF